MSKFIKNLVKWYGILTVGVWAWIGASHVFEKFADNPNITSSECHTEITEETFERYKKFLRKVVK